MPARAASIVFAFDPSSNTLLGTSDTFSQPLGSGNVSITASGLSGLSTTPSSTNLYENAPIDGSNPGGLGLCDTVSGSSCTAANTDIEKNQLVMMDFSLVQAQLSAQHQVFTQVQFTLDVDRPNSEMTWDIYASNTLNPSDAVELASNAMTYGGTISSGALKTLYSYYFVVVDCDNIGGLDVTNATLSYAPQGTTTPEPVTLMLSGAGLIGLALAHRRRTGKRQT